jgi:signal peptidase I
MLLNNSLLDEMFLGTGFAWIKIQGKSMSPVLKRGSIAGVIRCAYEDIFPGDIAVFAQENQPVCHRVIRRLKRGSEEYLVTKSDAGFKADPLVSKNNIIGKVVSLKCSRVCLNVDNFLFRIIGIFLSICLPFLARAKHIAHSLFSKL